MSDRYQLYVELVDSEPPIWRRVQVPAALSLAQLHPVLQAVMGWHDQATYFFRVGDRRWGHLANPQGVAEHSDTGLTLAEAWAIAPSQLWYTYDPQDGWLHRLQVEPAEVAPEAEPGAEADLRCLGGERACPPENSGGMWGYEELMEGLNDPDDPAYEILMDELGSEFDPDWFDLKAANQRLAALNG